MNTFGLEFKLNITASETLGSETKDTVKPRVPNKRISAAFLQALHAFLNNRGKPLAGSDIMKMTGLPSGTIYPLVVRMANAGWLVSEDEAVDPKLVGRPAKRLYSLTPSGVSEGEKILRSKFPDIGQEGNMSLRRTEA